MNAKATLLLLALLVTVSTAFAADEAELVTRFDVETGIGETVLANGLTVLTLERHSAPVVSCQVWYRVGSADEKSGETGLAHYLEHMMFKGTDRYAKGEIDRITLKLGGSNNAGTSRDFTYYYFNLAADRWEKALEIESNRMRKLKLDRAEFEAEKKVVIEELQMGRDNPWGEIDETIEATAYLSHPYRNPIVGWRNDVESMTYERMKAFYDLHYHPRNAILVIVGDFDTKHAIAKVQNLFGNIPSGPERERRWTPELPQRGERKILIRREAQVGRVQVIYHGTTIGGEDTYVHDVIAQVLAGSKSSRLNRRLVEEERIATFVTASDDSRQDPGLFWIWSEANGDADPEKVLASILDEVAKLAGEPVAQEELARAKTSILSGYVFSHTTAEESASQLGWLATVADWRMYGRHEARVRAVTPDDVRRVAKKLFRANNRTIAIQPPGSGEESGGAPPPLFGIARRAAKAAPAAPAAAPASVAVRLAPTEVRLENGLTLILLHHAAAPVTALRLRVDAGILREAKPGVAQLTGSALLEGAAGRDGIELSKEFETLGAGVGASTTGLTARCLAENTGKLVPLLADVLLRPDFPKDEIGKLRDSSISGIRAAKDDPDTLALWEFRRLLYGDHPRARPDLGTEESVAKLTREDVLGHYRTRYVPQETTIVAVTSLPLAEMKKILVEAFGGWKGDAPVDPKLPPMPEPEPVRHHITRQIDQANVYLGHLGVRRMDPDYYSLLVMDHVLGLSPGFTDRLSRTVRDRDGLAYSVYASFSNQAGVTRGSFRAYVGTSGDQRDRAIDAIIREVRRIREEKVTDEELSDAKAYLTGSFVFGYETAEQLARRLTSIHIYGLGFDYPERYAETVNAVTAEEVLRVAKKYLHPDKLTIVSVGP